jgi:hypothetical protein
MKQAGSEAMSRLQTAAYKLLEAVFFAKRKRLTARNTVVNVDCYGEIRGTARNWRERKRKAFELCGLPASRRLRNVPGRGWWYLKQTEI